MKTSSSPSNSQASVFPGSSGAGSWSALARGTVVAGLFLTLLPVAHAGEPPSRATAVPEWSDTVVITNDVLTSLYGEADVAEPGSTSQEAATPESFLPDPLRQIDLDLARRGDARRTVYNIQKELTVLEKKLQDLKTRRLAISNPFLPRPTLNKEEAAAWEGLDGAERVQETEDAIKKVQRELEAVQAAYSRAAQRV